jgi:hypothetical protein
VMQHAVPVSSGLIKLPVLPLAETHMALIAVQCRESDALEQRVTDSARNPYFTPDLSPIRVGRIEWTKV